MSDLKIIQAIEKQIAEPLRVGELETIMNGSSRCSYVLDKNQQVIALNLQNCQQTGLEPLKKLKNLVLLNLSSNQISQLTILKDFDKITQLNLQKNTITDLRPLKDLLELTQLNLQDNQIAELKPLKELNKLKLLNLQANQINELKALAGLTGLTTLNLGANCIKDLTSLKFLKQLIMLNLSSNQIIKLEPLQELQNLIELDLRFNQITNLEPFKHLKKLLRLYLSSNQITNLEPLRELKALSELYLSSNKITDISHLKNLNALTELDLRDNQISQIDVFINLQQLTGLYLENNQIADITPLENLTELTQLNLRNNQVSNIEPVKKLKNLKQLYLSNNNIQLLPKWIVDLNLKIKWTTGGDGISLIANPLKYPPPEIIRQGNIAIRAYFEALKQQQPLNEIKICFVGDSGAGKTSLIKLLRGENFDMQQPATQGISIADWQHQDITIHLWDFGGDSQMQATHSLFFSAQCLYVLVLDSHSKSNLKTWMKKIEYFAGNVPILIVLNKCDQSESYDVDRKYFAESFNSLQTNSFFSVSCADELGLDNFKQGLITGLKQVALFKKLCPENWFQVKNELEQQLKQRHYISSQLYEQICQQHDIKEKDHQSQLVQLLHDLGAIIHFKKFNLVETYILEPNWLIKSLYKIICSTQLINNKGLMLIKELGVILAKNNESDYSYSIEDYRNLLNLMRHLELCLLIDKTYISVPQLLDVNEPKYEFAQKDVSRFRIHYEYLSEAVISRLIVILQEDIVDKKYWRTGVLLKSKFLNCYALIKVNYPERLIIVLVNGERRQSYFAVIRKALRDIEATF